MQVWSDSFLCLRTLQSAAYTKILYVVNKAFSKFQKYFLGDESSFKRFEFLCFFEVFRGCFDDAATFSFQLPEINKKIWTCCNFFKNTDKTKGNPPKSSNWNFMQSVQINSPPLTYFFIMVFLAKIYLCPLPDLEVAVAENKK